MGAVDTTNTFDKGFWRSLSFGELGIVSIEKELAVLFPHGEGEVVAERMDTKATLIKQDAIPAGWIGRLT